MKQISTMSLGGGGMGVEIFFGELLILSVILSCGDENVILQYEMLCQAAKVILELLEQSERMQNVTAELLGKV